MGCSSLLLSWFAPHGYLVRLKCFHFCHGCIYGQPEPYSLYNRSASPGAREEMLELREKTKLTVHSTRYQVAFWLKVNGHMKYIYALKAYDGQQLLCMTSQEQIQLMESMEGTRKYMLFRSIDRCRERAGITSKKRSMHTSEGNLNYCYCLLSGEDREKKLYSRCRTAAVLVSAETQTTSCTE
jgi:hypothetical protein